MSLLDQFKAIRALPRSQRSFAAFEKRPDMLAARVDKDALDAFDFDDEGAVDEMIGRLGGGGTRSGAPTFTGVVAPAQPQRLERQAGEANPTGFRFVEDMVAEGESGLDGLAADFLANNLEHYTVGYDTPSEPSAEVIDAFYNYAKRAQGRRFCPTLAITSYDKR